MLRLSPVSAIVCCTLLGLAAWQLAVLGSAGWPAASYGGLIGACVSLLVVILAAPPLFWVPRLPRKCTALITGPTSGIGYELAKAIAAHGHDIILVARSAATLTQVAEETRALAKGAIRVEIIEKDLSRADAAEALYNEVLGRGLQVDILVNNAGFGLVGPICNASWAETRRVIDLNITAVTGLTMLFVPGMVARGFGKILNVSSTASRQPTPEMAVYAATKAFVTSFSVALSYELRKTGVTATCLEPGATRTAFQDHAGIADSYIFRLLPVATATGVARAGYDAMLRGDTNVIPGFSNWFSANGVPLVPFGVSSAIASMLMKRRS